MAENLSRHDEVTRIERMMVAHGWVDNLINDMLPARGMQEGYSERLLRTDLENAQELLEVTNLDDLLLRPGSTIGAADFIEYEDVDYPVLSLSYWHAFHISSTPERILLVAGRDAVEGAVQPMQYAGLAFDYKRGLWEGRQIIGLLASPDGNVEAMRIAYCMRDGESVSNEGMFRSHELTDTRTFIDCVREILTLTI